MVDELTAHYLFRPSGANNQPMYHYSSNARIQSYSPVALRYHLHNHVNYLFPFSHILYLREQGLWNLLWLSTPKVDEAIAIHDPESFKAFLDDTRYWLTEQSRALRRFIQSKTRYQGVNVSYNTLLRQLPAPVFAEFVLANKSFLKKLKTLVGKDAPTHLEERAHSAEHLHIENLLLPANDPERIVHVHNVQRSIARTENIRVAWLTRAGRLLETYFRSHGFDCPSYRIGMDNYSLRRLGVCAYDTLDSEDELGFKIGINPLMVNEKRVLEVLVHEFMHAITGLPAGHNATFWQNCEKVGLEGRRIDKSNEKLQKQFDQIHEEIGPYPGFQLRYCASTK